MTDDALPDRPPTHAERQAAIDRIQTAMLDDHLDFDQIGDRFRQVYDATTTHQIEAAVADLPAAPPRPMDHPLPATSFSLIGDLKRGGWVAVQPDTRAISLVGDVVLDLSTAELPADGVTVEAYSIIGDVKIIVPDGARVAVEGFAIIGDQRSDLTPPVPMGGEITIKAYSIIGDVIVTSLSQVRSRSMRRAWRQLRA